MGDDGALEARLERAHTVIGDLLGSLGEIDLLSQRQQAAAREAIDFREQRETAVKARGEVDQMRDRIKMLEEHNREMHESVAIALGWKRAAGKGWKDLIAGIESNREEVARTRARREELTAALAYAPGSIDWQRGLDLVRETIVQRNDARAELQKWRERSGWVDERIALFSDICVATGAATDSTADQVLSVVRALRADSTRMSGELLKRAEEYQLAAMGELAAIRAALPSGDEQVPVADRVAQLVCEHKEMLAEMMNGTDPEDLADAASTLAEPPAKPASELELVEFIDVVFDGPPGPTSSFVEVEDHRGHSMKVGEWIDRGDGMWALRIPMQPPAAEVGEVMAAAGALSALTAVVATSEMNWQHSPCLA